jgi:hypothetical protein
MQFVLGQIMSLGTGTVRKVYESSIEQVKIVFGD